MSDKILDKMRLDQTPAKIDQNTGASGIDKPSSFVDSSKLCQPRLSPVLGLAFIHSICLSSDPSPPSDRQSTQRNTNDEVASRIGSSRSRKHMMRWPWSSDNSSDGPKPARHWNESLNKTDWEHYKEPRNWMPTAIATTTILAAVQFYRSYLRRIPGTNYIHPGFFRRRSLFGRVTSVGDGDNFHLFHTPGGRLAGWSWLRSVPTDRKALKGKTIPVRIAGVDAPEGAHFGREAQPFSAEALSFLTSYILGRNVRAHIYRRDQYERVVGTVWVRRWLFRRDVGLEMIKRGLATVYDAKIGAEFGGLEEKYRAAEAKAKMKKLGMWGGKGKFESPREYKNRHSTTTEGKIN